MAVFVCTVVFAIDLCADEGEDTAEGWRRWVVVMEVIDDLGKDGKFGGGVNGSW